MKSYDDLGPKGKVWRMTWMVTVTIIFLSFFITALVNAFLRDPPPIKELTAEEKSAKALEEGVTEAADDAQAALTTAVETATEAATDVASQAEEAAASLVGDAAETATETVSETVEQAAEATDEAAASVTDTATEAVSSAQETASETASAGAETAAAVSETATESAENATAAMTDYLTLDGFDFDKVAELIDASALDDVKKTLLRTTLEGAKDNPELLAGVLEQIKQALGL